MSENNQYAYDTGAKKSADEEAVFCLSVYNPNDKDFNVQALAKNLWRR